MAHVDIDPPQGWLLPSQSLELTVTITPRQYGSVTMKIAFDLLYSNFPRNPNEYQIVGDGFMTISFQTPCVTTQPKTRFNMGLAPDYVREVGYHVDDVRFSTPLDVPKAVMPRKYKLKEQRKNNDDLIAFPNDSPRSLRPWRNPVR